MGAAGTGVHEVYMACGLLPLGGKGRGTAYVYGGGHSWEGILRGGTPSQLPERTSEARGFDCTGNGRLCMFLDEVIGVGCEVHRAVDFASASDLVVDAEKLSTGQTLDAMVALGSRLRGLLAFYGNGWDSVGHVRYCLGALSRDKGACLTLGAESGSKTVYGDKPTAGLYLLPAGRSAQWGDIDPDGASTKWRLLGLGRIKAALARVDPISQEAARWLVGAARAKLYGGAEPRPASDAGMALVRTLFHRPGGA